MDGMNDTNTTPPSRGPDVDALAPVATSVRAAARLANTAAGGDLYSPWLDVLAETVTAAGHLTDIPDAPNAQATDPTDRTDPALESPGAATLAALEEAAAVLDAAPGHRDPRAILVRASLTDAITLARRIPR